MIEHKDLLEIFAQIFIAFGGFSGVIAAFSTIRLSPEATVFRVRALVVVALFSLVASLLPFLVGAFQASELVALRFSAFFLGLGIFGIGLWVWRQLSSLYAARLLDTQIYAAMLCIVAAPIAVGLLAVSGGLVQEMAAAIYLSGLFLGLVLCSYYFVMVIFAVEMKTRK
jgi:hypothetical protein